MDRVSIGKSCFGNDLLTDRSQPTILDLPEVQRELGAHRLVLEALDGEGGVMSTEAEAVAENGVYVALDGLIGSVVEVELRIGVLVVDRWWDDTGADHHRADDRL